MAIISLATSGFDLDGNLSCSCRVTKLGNFGHFSGPKKSKKIFGEESANKKSCLVRRLKVIT